jgi:CarD family transcriptional regulator
LFPARKEEEQAMTFQVGDTVIHASHGLGKIIGVEEKAVGGSKVQFYVVRTKDFTIWIPADGGLRASLRCPTGKSDFHGLSAILSGTSEPLAADRMERKGQLQRRMQEGNSASICRLIRDLWHFRLANKLNENDSATLDRAQGMLLDEWSFSLAIPLPQAKAEMKRILDENFQRAT